MVSALGVKMIADWLIRRAAAVGVRTGKQQGERAVAIRFHDHSARLGGRGRRIGQGAAHLKKSAPATKSIRPVPGRGNRARDLGKRRGSHSTTLPVRC